MDEITSYAEQEKVKISESDIFGMVTAREFDNELSSSDFISTSD